MSNGNVALMTNVARFAGLQWDVILGSDLVEHYKPDREMYLSAPLISGPEARASDDVRGSRV